MKQYDISISREQMAGLLSEENVFGDMVREVINQVLQAQMSEHLGADKYERNDDRVGMRNGNRTRQFLNRLVSQVSTQRARLGADDYGNVCARSFNAQGD